MTERSLPWLDRIGGMIALTVFLTAMWALEIADQVLRLGLDSLGIEPRSFDGLIGIFASPLLHGDMGHLIGNTVPLAVMGIAIALAGITRLLAVASAAWAASGVGIWLVGAPGSEHIGASGIVFGFAAYLVVRAVRTRRPLDLLLGVAVLALYGPSLLIGLVPTSGISLSGHLFGLVGGALIAWHLPVPAATPPAEQKLARSGADLR